MILVDDGSTDDTSRIAIELTKYDNRFRTIRQNNAGQNAARRLGFREAIGKYIFFSDSDDILNEKTISSLVELAEKTSSDMVVANIMDVYPATGQHKISSWFYEQDTYSKKGIILSFLYNLGNGSLCGKLYRRDKFCFDTIWMDENIRANEDYLVYIQNVIKNFDRFAFSSYVGYNYIHREGTMSSHKEMKTVKDMLDVSYFLHCLIYSTFPKDQNINEALSYYASKKLYFTLAKNIDVVSHEKRLIHILYSIARSSCKTNMRLSLKDKVYIRLSRSNPFVIAIFKLILRIKHIALTI